MDKRNHKIGGNTRVTMPEKEKKHLQMSDSIVVMIFLTFSGGLQDAYSYFVRGQVFANAQTGNVVFMATNFFAGNVQRGLRYLLPILAFLTGIAITDYIRAHSNLSGRMHWRHVVVGVEIVLLFVVGLLPITSIANPIANALTSMACAMQIQAFRKVRGQPYASTMCIGNMRSGVEALGSYFRRGESVLLRQAKQYFFVVLIFFVGAGVGSLLANNPRWYHLTQYIIWISCVLLLASFILMSVHKDMSEEPK